MKCCVTQVLRICFAKSFILRTCTYYKKGIIIKNFFMCSLNTKEKNWLFDDSLFSEYYQSKLSLNNYSLEKKDFHSALNRHIFSLWSWSFSRVNVIWFAKGNLKQMSRFPVSKCTHKIKVWSGCVIWDNK